MYWILYDIADIILRSLTLSKPLICGFKNFEGNNDLLIIRKNYDAIKLIFFNDSNIDLFSIAPHIVIALPSLQKIVCFLVH